MKYKISAKNDSVVNAGITTDYHQAIVEYIWNGFDGIGKLATNSTFTC